MCLLNLIHYLKGWRAKENIRFYRRKFGQLLIEYNLSKIILLMRKLCYVKKMGGYFGTVF